MVVFSKHKLYPISIILFSVYNGNPIQTKIFVFHELTNAAMYELILRSLKGMYELIPGSSKGICELIPWSCCSF